MTLKQHSIFWLIAIIAFVIFMLTFSSIMLPFVAGMAIAYFLDPMTDKLEEWGLSRVAATSVMMALFTLIFILALLLILPLLFSQLGQLLSEIPDLIARIQEFLKVHAGDWFGDLFKQFFSGEEEANSELTSQISSFAGKIASLATTLVANIWSGGMALFSFISLIVVTPVVAFYLLNDWDHMIEVIASWVPRNHKETVFSLANQMSDVLAGFVRGQGSVCLILAIYYAITLSIVGLKFGLVIGIISGLISFIPFVGAIVGLFLSVGLALIQMWPDYISIGLVALIFIVGQFLEGNVLTPRLVGRHIGLHPVWLMFALFAFGALFGFVGMLLAVPVAAMIGVLSRFAIQQYLKSPFYLGLSPNLIEDEEESKKASDSK